MKQKLYMKNTVTKMVRMANKNDANDSTLKLYQLASGLAQKLLQNMLITTKGITFQAFSSKWYQWQTK